MVGIKRLTIYLLFIFCICSLLAHLYLILDIGIGENQANARLSKESLNNMPKGLVLLSSNSWNNRDFNRHDIQEIHTWLGNSDNASIEFNENTFVYKVSFSNFNSKNESFSSLLGKLSLVANSELEIFRLNKKTNQIQLTVRQY